MNRIYQGRISRVEKLARAGDKKQIEEWSPLPEGEQMVWAHHVLFQDATNYYLAALLSLASEPDNPLFVIRQRLSPEDPELARDQIWKSFSRRGSKRKGFVESLGRHLGFDPHTATPDDVFQTILRDNEASAQIRDLALKELLAECNGEGAIQQKGREMLPRFCWSDFSGSYPHAATARAREENTLRLHTELHELDSPSALTAFAVEVDLGWVVNLDTSKPNLSEEDSRERLIKAVDHFAQAFGGRATTKLGERARGFLQSKPQSAANLQTLRERIAVLGANELPSIPRNRKSIPDRSEALLLFKYFPSPFTADLLRLSFPVLDAKKRQRASRNQVDNSFLRFGDDPIKLARGKRGFVFPAFTCLPSWKDAVPGQPAWKEFDIAAFKEALKAIHQIETKSAERKAEQAQLERLLDCMEGRAKWFTTDESEMPRPVLIACDPRIKQLEKIQQSLASSDDSLDEELREYGIRSRTIRGFRELATIWRQKTPPGTPKGTSHADQLKEILREHQTKNRDSMGSARLFEELTHPENWHVWLEPSPEEMQAWRNALPNSADRSLDFAPDPLTALARRLEIEREISELDRPVRLTPADPRYSRRQFYFSDVVSFSQRGNYRHDTAAMAVTVPIAVETDQGWIQQRVRLCYAAPRLKRDRLRAEDGSLGSTAGFHQPMMEALGVPPAVPKDLSKLAVALMPEGLPDESGRSRLFLNFPIEIDTAPIRRHIGKASAWDKQFASADGKNMYLRWPSLTSGLKSPPQKWWWEDRRSFTVLAVDLGQRFAAALARLEVTGDAPSREKPGRFIGRSGETSWHVGGLRTALVRLAGEDAQLVEKGQRRQEPFGSAGRPADAAEVEEAREICRRLAFDMDDRIGGANTQGSQLKRFPSFPELNDILLIAHRRGVARLRRYQRTLRTLHDDAKAGLIQYNELRASGDEDLPSIKDASSAKAHLEEACHRLRGTLSETLVDIAGRVAPSRDRRWIWEQAKKEGPANHCLVRSPPLPQRNRGVRLRGQRGLSMDRIEQLEELRRRAQALNRALLNDDPSKATIGGPLRGLDLPDACPEIGEKILRLKEERLNQTAHQIVAEALGLRLKPPTKSKAQRRDRDIHGEYEKVREPVDFIVLEDLSRYLSSQGRAPSENSRLMRWCHRAVLHKLIELAEPYGIPILQTNPAYSSRFCSRSGVAGFRAVEVTHASRYAFPWKHELAQYERVCSGDLKPEPHRRARLEMTHLLFAQLEKLEATRTGRPPRSLLAPQPGGPIFVPSRGPTTNADLNAAINLGLRAIAEPSVLDVHVRIVSAADNGTLRTLAKSRHAAARWGVKGRLIEMHKPEELARLLKESRQPNFFVDLGCDADFQRARVDGIGEPIASGKGLWGSLRQKEWRIINRLNNNRLEKKEWLGHRPLPEEPEPVSSSGSPWAEDDDIPYNE